MNITEETETTYKSKHFSVEVSKNLICVNDNHRYISFIPTVFRYVNVANAKELDELIALLEKVKEKIK